MRSKSVFALSLITVVFKDGSESYWARQRLLERIAGRLVAVRRATGVDPLTSPMARSSGTRSKLPTRTRRELSELQRWTVIPALKQVPVLLMYELRR